MSYNPSEQAATEGEYTAGYFRWLRPDNQAPESTKTSVVLTIDVGKLTPIAEPQGKETWPKSIPDQVAIIRTVLTNGA
jgi:hypothetical protein